MLSTSVLRKFAVGFGVLWSALYWAPASAVTVDLSANSNAIAGSPSVYTVSQNFVLPSGFSNASLSVTDLYIDDRGILQLNGVTIDSAGIFGPGTTTLDLSTSGPTVAQSYGPNGARSLTVTTGFVVGTNTLTILVNDTNAGINGSSLAGGVNISGTALTAMLQYDDNIFVVTPSAGANGSIAPSTPQSVASGATTSFTVTPNSGFSAAVGGTCGGTLVGTTYTTNPITQPCTVAASFNPLVRVSGASPIPALAEWAMLILILGLAALGMRGIRRR